MLPTSSVPVVNVEPGNIPYRLATVLSGRVNSNSRVERCVHADTRESVIVKSFSLKEDK